MLPSSEPPPSWQALLEELLSRLDVLEEADTALLDATAAGFSPEALPPLCHAVEEYRERASPSALERAEQTLLEWLARERDNQELLAAPADRAPLTAALQEHSAHASAEVVAEAHARLEALVDADAQLLTTMETEDVVAIRATLGKVGLRASPGVALSAQNCVLRLVEQADASLCEEMVQVAEAPEARRLLGKYEGCVSEATMAKAAEWVQRLVGSDAALQSAIRAGEAEALRSALHAHGQEASRSLAGIAGSQLARLEADAALRAALADQQALREAVDANRQHASPAALAKAQERLAVLAAADGALEAAKASGSIRALRLAVAQHRGHASCAAIPAAEAALLTLEAAADASLREEAAALREATALGELVQAYAERATAPVLEEVTARLRRLEDSDGALSEASDREFHLSALGPLQRCLERHRERSSPSVRLEAETVLQRWMSTDAANRALRSAPADRVQLTAAIAANEAAGASLEVVAEARTRLDVLDIADAALRMASEAADVHVLREAIASRRVHASASAVEAALTLQRKIEAAADERLERALMEVVEVPRARAALKEYGGQCSVAMLSRETQKWRAADAANAALLEAMHSCTVGELTPAELDALMRRCVGVATPSVIASAELTHTTTRELLNLEADNALCSASTSHRLREALKETRECAQHHAQHRFTPEALRRPPTSAPPGAKRGVALLLPHPL